MTTRLSILVGSAAVSALASLGACGGDEPIGPALEEDEQGIVNGKPAGAREFPFATALFVRHIKDGVPQEDAFCGGTLIDREWVLTAAHCLDGIPSYALVVGVGLPNLSSYARDARGFLVPDGVNASAVEATWIHPRYDKDRLNFDVGLVRLAQPLSAPVADFIDTVAQERRFAARNTQATAVGWGATNQKGNRFPDRLKKAMLPIVNGGQCADRVRQEYGFPYTDRMMCAGGGKTDTCFGDSGGPLLVKGPQNRWLVAGLTSFGLSTMCAKQGTPAVYSRMARLAPWVKGCMANINACGNNGGPPARNLDNPDIDHADEEDVAVPPAPAPAPEPASAPAATPIAGGLFTVPNDLGIYFSNGENAYCHVSTPEHIALYFPGAPIRQEALDVRANTYFRFDGFCSFHIPAGFFAAPGLHGIFWSNGQDAFCWVPHPKYVSGPVTTYNFAIASTSYFRQDGACPGMI